MSFRCPQPRLLVGDPTQLACDDIHLVGILDHVKMKGEVLKAMILVGFHLLMTLDNYHIVATGSA